MALEVRDVTVDFGGHRALDDVTFDAQPGQITALIGPNGAGKTTIFNVITGVQPPKRGTVLLDGEPLDRLPVHRRARRGLARTFQRLELFPSLTVRDNIRVAAAGLPRSQRHIVVEDVLHRLGLTSIADTRSGEVSTGTGRLIELARCLVTNPKALLLDEPASGQDDQETAAFKIVLRQLADDGHIVLLVEHDMDLVMSVCDRIHVLDFGKLLASGTPAEIRADVVVQAAYLGTEVDA